MAADKDKKPSSRRPSGSKPAAGRPAGKAGAGSSRDKSAADRPFARGARSTGGRGDEKSRSESREGRSEDRPERRGDARSESAGKRPGFKGKPTGSSRTGEKRGSEGREEKRSYGSSRPAGRPAANRSGSFSASPARSNPRRPGRREDPIEFNEFSEDSYQRLEKEISERPKGGRTAKDLQDRFLKRKTASSDERDRPAPRPRPSSDADERPARRPSAAENRPAGPRKRDTDSGAERPFKPRSRDTDSDTDRPFKPRSRDAEGAAERPSRAGSRDTDSATDRPFKPRSRDAESDTDRPVRRASRDAEAREDRPVKRREAGDFSERKTFAKKTDRPFGKRDDAGSTDRPYKKRDDSRSPDRADRPAPRGKGEAGKTARPASRAAYGSKERLDETPDYDLRPYERKLRKQREAEDEKIRLNRYIAQAGVCSRREADELITAGEIKVNGQVITELGFLVNLEDTIQYGKKILNREKLVYVLLNKPKDFLTTTEDPEERKTVMELVANASKERIFPVGRLDRNTTGLLLFTNDGELAQKLTHPSHSVAKVYQAELDKPLTPEHAQQITDGLELEDGPANVDDLALLSPDRTVVGLELHIGRNRIVRRIFEHLGYEVVKLDRVAYAGLDKKDLTRGHWRYLTEKEVIRLKYFL